MPCARSLSINSKAARRFFWNSHENENHSLKEVLQAAEDALLRPGYDDYMIVTENGSFHWMTVERARQRQAEDETHHEHTRH
jgi:hypothetical protein